MVSSATKAGPGSRAVGALDPPAPAPPSAHTSRLAHTHTISPAEVILAIPCMIRFPPPTKRRPLEVQHFYEVLKEIVLDGSPRVVGEVEPRGARECTHPWNPAITQACPEEQ